MKLEIRRARPDEADALTDLSMRSKRSNGYDDAFMDACREELTVTPKRLAEGEYWVAVADDICGCACLLPDEKDASGEIHAFFIDPELKRQGIGRLLWSRVLRSASAKRLVRLHLDADPYAVPFYESLGFVVVDKVPSGSIPGRFLPKMELCLGAGR